MISRAITSQSSFLAQFLDFGFKQAWSCIFPVAIFATLALTHFTHSPLCFRYDQILIVCLLVQAAMYFGKLETFDEIKVICLFHFFGLALEIFKTHVGSWSYPEAGLTKILGVPLYSGFLYASVASYICQAWRRLDLRLEHWPKSVSCTILGCAIYLNFFTNHWIFDFRWVLFALVFLVFRKTTVYYTVAGYVRHMSLVLSFFLIGFFIWIAENISTFLHGWQYPYQAQHWDIVHAGKISSWCLLVIISIILVAQLKHIKSRAADDADPVQIDNTVKVPSISME
ncbi:MAG: DUF817 domain-containing protein [Candidatus Obscuribacterales bacterium]|nr:DUF817 domain-containing protein [Candidatus Obscuribacterales bacterium]